MLQCLTLISVRDNERIYLWGENKVLFISGTYPYVTSSNCSIGGVCTGLGIPPKYDIKDKFRICLTQFFIEWSGMCLE